MHFFGVCTIWSAAVVIDITGIIFVTGRDRRAIDDQLNKDFGFGGLERHGTTQILQFVRNVLGSDIKGIWIRQAEVLGFRHAVL